MHRKEPFLYHNDVRHNIAEVHLVDLPSRLLADWQKIRLFRDNERVGIVRAASVPSHLIGFPYQMPAAKKPEEDEPQISPARSIRWRAVEGNR